MSDSPFISDITARLTLNFDQIAALLCQHPQTVLLDSAHAQHPDSRFSILGWSPQAWLVADAGQLFVEERGCATPLPSTDPFTALDELTERYAPATPRHPTLPFLGGALGYWGYDIGRYLEKLPSTASDDISLPDMAVGIYQQALVYDQAEQRLHLVAPTAAAATDILEQLGQLGTADLSPHFCLRSQFSANLSRADYAARFAQIQSYLRSGDCYQINLAQRFSSQFDGDPFAAYQRLSRANRAPFSAFIRLNERQAVASISPERFISLKGDRIETKPIKGTVPRGTSAETDQHNKQWLANSEKDQAENLMIVDLLRNDLGKVALPGSVQVPKLFDIESFAAVHHLVSTVTAQLEPPYNAFDLLKAAFPGGSITGAPKIRAMEIIDELEPHRRNVYCGAIGYISRCGCMDTNIAIRTLVFDHPWVHCWAGGGIVADSNVDAEYQETFDKVATIIPPLEHAYAAR